MADISVFPDDLALATPVNAMGFSEEVRRALLAEGIFAIGEMIGRNDAYYAKLEHVCRRGFLAKFDELLEKMGLHRNSFTINDSQRAAFKELLVHNGGAAIVGYAKGEFFVATNAPVSRLTPVLCRSNSYLLDSRLQ